jgi:hypothetical protein
MEMKRNPDIINELQPDCPVLAGLLPLPPQEVPDGYFARLPELILSQVKAAAGRSLPAAPESSIPAGYFDELPLRVMERIRSEALDDTIRPSDELPTVLAGLSRDMPYQVAVGYFEGFAEQATESLKPTATVVTLSRKFTWTRYAAAAAVTGLLLFSGWYLLFNGRTDAPQVGKFTETVAQSKPADSLKVSDGELASFLEETQGLENLSGSDHLVNTPPDLALLDLDEKGIREILHTVPDNALAEFINETPGNTSVNRSN